MPIVKCKICSSKFYAKPNWIKIGHGKYCSKKCQYKSYKLGKVVACLICNKDTYKAPRFLKRAKHYFCSKSCQTVWRNSMIFIGPKHFNWKGGENAYRNVLLHAKIPKICKKCKNRDERILAAHHIDKNRKNNNLNNLVWLCHNCHFLIHHYDKEVSKFKGLLA